MIKFKVIFSKTEKLIVLIFKAERVGVRIAQLIKACEKKAARKNCLLDFLKRRTNLMSRL